MCGIPPILNGPKFLSSTAPKAKYFCEIFSKKCNEHDLSGSLPTLPTRTFLKLHVSLTYVLVKKATSTLDCSEAPVSDSITTVILQNCEPKLLQIIASLFSICL